VSFEFVAQESTTTTEVQRVVGEHPGNAVVLGAAAALLVAILLAGFAVRRRAAGSARRP
jgi:hypothetical protein